MNRLVLLLGIFFVTASVTTAQDQWDWHISGGTIVDGSGRPAYQADVLIRGDSIGFIGDVDADTIDAAHVVDAYGKTVAPGFVDVHAHGDPRSNPEFQNFLAMGVTTIVLGQDGSSPGGGALAEWFDQVEDARPAVNVAALTGHGSLRRWSGADNDKASAQDISRMEELLRSDLQAGSWGMSLGLEYVPGLNADKEELLQLAEFVGRHDGIIMSHMRSEDDIDMEKSIDELAAQGAYAQVHVSHLKAVYGQGAERAGEILAYIESYRDQGIKLSADTYPYSASFTGIAIVFPKWAKTNEQWQQVMKERPSELRQYLLDKVEQRNGPEAILFGSGPYAGKTLKEVADEQRRPYVDVLLEIGPQAASAAHFVMNEELQDHLTVAPGVMISSDGSPTMRHPRGYGSFAKVIRRYVVEQRSMTLEEAVHKMSGLPAETLGLGNRGVLREGYKADLIVFDPANISDTATFEQPHKLAEGFDWVLVNGKVARNNGEFAEGRYGEVLKKSATN